MKWNKFPEKLPPENTSVIVLMPPKKNSPWSIKDENDDIVSPAVAEWSLSFGWFLYGDERTFNLQGSVYWCEVPKIDYEMLNFFRDKYR